MADGELGLVPLAESETAPVLWVVEEWWGCRGCGEMAEHDVLCSYGMARVLLGLE